MNKPLQLKGDLNRSGKLEQIPQFPPLEVCVRSAAIIGPASANGRQRKHGIRIEGRA
jgi:hypothetical protein